MLGGLYRDLPPPSSAEEDNKPTTNVWSSTKMAPATLRKPASIFPPPQTLLCHSPSPSPRPRPRPRPRPPPFPSPQTPLLSSSDDSSLQPALVTVQSTVLEEYDLARPNDYEEYCQYRKSRAREAEIMKKLERRRHEEEEEERERERERDKERDNVDSRLNVSGEEAWMRRAAMSGAGGNGGNGGGAVPRSPSPPLGNLDGFTIGKSETGGIGGWGRGADDGGAADDGEDGVEGGSRVGEIGAGDYYSFLSSF